MGEKFCENCGNQLNEGAKFCSSCGSVVSTNTSETTTNRGEEKKVCTNCGSQLYDGEKFCSNCGSSVDLTNTSEKTTNQEEKKKFCTNCGSQLYDGVKFCSNCGSSVDLSNKPGSRTIGGQRKVGSNNSNPFNQIQDYYEQTKKQYGNLTDQELGFVGSVKYALVHWIDFKGVESRKSVYWWLCLGIIVISICIGILEEILVVLFSNIPVLDVIGTFIVLVAMIAWGFIALIAYLSAIVRRMRYLNVQNITMWIILTLVIPIIVGLYTELYLMLIDKPINNQN
ncbi:zinc-ribbon domain-containing protein [Ligilactobacillus salivarius]|nr:zinc-ribbon domain-containing protein [Lactobacillus sp.]